MECVDDETLQAIGEGRRTIDPEAEAHLGRCVECRRALACAAHGAGAARPAAGEPAPPDDEPSWDELGAGVVVDGRYAIESFLGDGAMGVVWSARRVDDGLAVALKVARSTDADFNKRFDREARVALALEHPNIVRALGKVAATEVRGPCLVMELLEGETLAARLERTQRMEVGETARVAYGVASALAAAHARGIVHRDVKPANVFLAATGVKVLDFGVAKLTDPWGPHTKLTRSGTAVGTPRYMAPEQLMGEPDVDARADIWALGALVFRMLGGRSPVHGETLGATIRSVEAGDVADLADVAPGLPNAVYGVVREALAVDPTKRLGDVSRFLEALGPYRGA
jgi:serine/threonine-protein kinase